MVNNYVEQIRNFIIANNLFQFADVKTISLAKSRINLLLESRLKPSDELINLKSDLFTFSYAIDGNSYLCVFVCENNQEALDAIKEALLVF